MGIWRGGQFKQEESIVHDGFDFKLQPFMLLNGHWFSFLVSTFLVVSCLANSNVSKCTSLNILAGEFPTTRMCASFVVQVLIFRIF